MSVDLFEWCKQCAYYKDCYKQGSPRYLEPACGEGPATPDNSDYEVYV